MKKSRRLINKKLNKVNKHKERTRLTEVLEKHRDVQQDRQKTTMISVGIKNKNANTSWKPNQNRTWQKGEIVP